MRTLLKLNKKIGEEHFILYQWLKKNCIENMPSQPACKALDVILGLKYKAYSNWILQRNWIFFVYKPCTLEWFKRGKKLGVTLIGIYFEIHFGFYSVICTLYEFN